MKKLVVRIKLVVSGLAIMALFLTYTALYIYTIFVQVAVYGDWSWFGLLMIATFLIGGAALWTAAEGGGW